MLPGGSALFGPAVSFGIAGAAVRTKAHRAGGILAADHHGQGEGLVTEHADFFGDTVRADDVGAMLVEEMHARMGAAGQELQIIEAAIAFVPVAMVDDASPGNRAIRLLIDQAMQVVSPSAFAFLAPNPDAPVAVFVLPGWTDGFAVGVGGGVGFHPHQ